MENETRACQCQECNEKDQTVIWHSIGPFQKEAAMDTSLFKWTCKKCQKVYKFVYPCTYVDREKGFVVRYQGNDKEFDTHQDFSGLIKRDCNSQEELAEKIRILDAGLDDRAMELTKLLVFAQIHVQDETLERIQFYQEEEDGFMSFTIWNSEGPDGIQIDRETYERVVELANEIPELSDEFHCIDLNWAGAQVTD